MGLLITRDNTKLEFSLFNILSLQTFCQLLSVSLWFASRPRCFSPETRTLYSQPEVCERLPKSPLLLLLYPPVKHYHSNAYNTRYRCEIIYFCIQRLVLTPGQPSSAVAFLVSGVNLGLSLFQRNNTYCLKGKTFSRI